ncbi:MAG: prephenate dehydrogenase/arogenate dehydrogenase family protein [Halothiobacillaceae bacterium]|nr:MAG: prephenate dehydrogenase/arogenate dehydrogenase family protein [Halothiobacillaceae bacterium]
MSFYCPRLCIVGSGLIGGSLALALKKAGRVGEVVGAGRNEATLQRAQELGIIDRHVTDIAEAARGADIVVLSVPLLAMRQVFEQLAPVLRPGMVLTDVGSAKTSVIEDARAVLGQKSRQFVPGHPIAGTEKSGPDAAFAGLFEGRKVILTPLSDNDAGDVARIRAMWRIAGAEVEGMTALHHDHVLAATSHLPHLLAFALVESLARMEERHEVFRYAAGGFRDFTRIAASDPTMWRDIALANAAEIKGMLKRYQKDLDHLYALLDQGDGEALHALFNRARQAREGLKL